MDKIDFVLPWVDGSDGDWQAAKRMYENAAADMPRSDLNANADCRYRDYGLLKYWFRAVERFAPWVGRVFFVTCGQKPEWLDVSNPKLRLVNHDEYIPGEYLPTFHSNTIELNLHRIAELSERFVLFNDDLFLLRPVSPDFFFKKGLPVTACDLGIPSWLGYSNISRIAINNCGALKQSMDVNRLVWKHIWKFVDPLSLGFVRAAKNFAAFSVNRTVIGGTFGHLAQSHLKSTFDEIWRKQPQIMDTTSRRRFRGDDCVNHWLACAWNMVSGRFCPANEKRRGRFIAVNTANLGQICGIIRKRSFPQICLNDSNCGPDLEFCIGEISKALDELLPEKSSFER